MEVVYTMYVLIKSCYTKFVLSERRSLSGRRRIRASSAHRPSTPL